MINAKGSDHLLSGIKKELSISLSMKDYIYSWEK